MPPGLFPFFLVAHIALAIALFVPSLLLPFAFRARRGSLRPDRSGGFVRFLLALQSKGTVWIGLGLAITGLGLLASLGFTMLQRQLESLLDSLSEREAGVIRMRFGLGDGQPKTLDQIGDTFGVTRERIRQIESKTMAKLRHPSRSQSLRDYLE